MDFKRPNILASIGAPVVDFMESCGMLFLFTVEAFRRIFARHMIRRVAWQVYVIGAKSFWLILLIGLAGTGFGGFLVYPEGLAKAAMLSIEYSLFLSIGATLALLVTGPNVIGLADPAGGTERKSDC